MQKIDSEPALHMLASSQRGKVMVKKQEKAKCIEKIEMEQNKYTHQ